MSVSVKEEIIPSQKAGQHYIHDNVVPENIENCSPRLRNFLMNSTCAVEYLSLGSESRNASVSFPEITMKDDNDLIEKSVLDGNDRRTTFDVSALQKNSEKRDHSSTSPRTEFIDSALIETDSDKQNASKEPDESCPSTKRFKRLSSPVELQNKTCESRFQRSSLGFVMRCNPKRIVFGNIAAETSTVEENCSEDDNNPMFSSDVFAEESSNQPTTESVDSEEEISFVEIQQSGGDCSSQKLASINFPNEVKKIFEKIFKGIEGFNKIRPKQTTRMIQLYLSHRRQFIKLQNSQQQCRVEAMHRLAACLKFRVNAQKYTDTQSTSTSREHAQEDEEIAPRSVAESSLRKPPISSNLRNRLLYLYNDLVNYLKMLMHLSKLILGEYANESGIDFGKIFDYVLCFGIMKEDYSEQLKRFKNMEKDAESDSGRFRTCEILFLHVQCLIKVLDGNIAKVEYGIFILKLHEKLHEKLHKGVLYTSTRIKQMMRLIKVYEFGTKEN